MIPVSSGRAGYVLVGGRSSRMGQDKALLPFRGGTLVQHVAAVVARAAGSVTLVGDPARYGTLGYPVLPDLYPGEGPLGGVISALAHAGADWNLVLACDMPGVSHELLVRLLEGAEASDAEVLAPAGASGRPEPLCAVYHRRALGRLERLFARGERKMSRALAALHTVISQVDASGGGANVNTPADWAAYARH
ncbi:MAG TPA: molybdenum cofactor guanylyltransferase [Bryobacteraceae bacterium]|nr:molybdenum cofactor guanylyltransferase [Bryobacteraceae bacterium]